MTDGTIGPEGSMEDAPSAPDERSIEPASEAAGPDSPEGAPGIPPRAEPRQRSDDDKLELIHRHTLLAAATASGMKGEDIRILDVHDLVTYTDFLVICTGRSSRQAGRIAEEVALKLKKEIGLVPSSVEGERPGEWILLDYLDFIVHVFTPEARDFYRLDVLWKQAPLEVIE